MFLSLWGLAVAWARTSTSILSAFVVRCASQENFASGRTVVILVRV